MIVVMLLLRVEVLLSPDSYGGKLCKIGTLQIMYTLLYTRGSIGFRRFQWAMNRYRLFMITYNANTILIALTLRTASIFFKAMISLVLLKSV